MRESSLFSESLRFVGFQNKTDNNEASFDTDLFSHLYSMFVALSNEYFSDSGKTLNRNSCFLFFSLGIDVILTKFVSPFRPKLSAKKPAASIIVAS